MPDENMLTLAIFASDKGPGDAERASVMTQTGAYLAKRGAKLICLSDGDALPVPMITSARAAGGQVEVFSDKAFQLPSALKDIGQTRIVDRQERLAQFALAADCFVGLPGSLASITNLFFTTLNLGGGKPVVLFNHHNAFEVIRGFSVDVLAHGKPSAEQSFQIADSLDDVWNKVSRMTNFNG